MIEILEDKKIVLDDENEVNIKEETLEVEENQLNNDDIPEPNCLALTVRKDYNLTIVKNIFTTTGRLSWKVILSTLVLNFLNMIF